MSRRLNHTKANLKKKIAMQGYVFTDQAAPQKLNLRIGSPPDRIVIAKPAAAPAPPKPSQNSDYASRLRFISDVKRAISNGKTPPNPPKRFGAELRVTIQKIGLVKWVISQPEYASVEFILSIQNRNRSEKNILLEAQIKSVERAIAQDSLRLKSLRLALLQSRSG